MSAELRLSPPESRLEEIQVGVRNVSWHLNRTRDPLIFRLRARMSKSKKANWRLRVIQVGSEGDAPIREFYGTGRPPARITWDGSSADGKKGLLERGGSIVHGSPSSTVRVPVRPVRKWSLVSATELPRSNFRQDTSR